MNKQVKWAASPGDRKQAKSAEIGTSRKEVRGSANPWANDSQTVAWQFHRRDNEHGAWGWSRKGEQHLESLLRDHLHHIETMTWAEVTHAAGGRSHGNNSHSIPVAQLCRDAQKRLLELNFDDVDELFSLRLSGTVRVWGIRDGRVLKILWYDEDHSVYPSRR